MRQWLMTHQLECISPKCKVELHLKAVYHLENLIFEEIKLLRSTEKR